MTSSEPAPTWVLLEGTSDVAAVRALRATRGIMADDAPCLLVDMGGATNIRRHLDLAVEHHPRPHVVGLCDEREAPWFVRALDVHRDALALAAPPTLATLPRLGFHVCRRDLEDELLRALGVGGSLAVLDDLGLATAFEAFTRQLAWRGRPVRDQLRRFGSTTSGRKELLAGAMAAALDIDATPRPLAALLDSLPAGQVVADLA